MNASMRELGRFEKYIIRIQHVHMGGSSSFGVALRCIL
jgi:hypothetical protein